MTSFLFVVTVPTAQYERELKTKAGSRSTESQGISESLSSNGLAQDDSVKVQKVNEALAVQDEDKLGYLSPRSVGSETMTSSTEDDISLEELVSRVLSRLKVSDCCWNVGRPTDNRIRVSFTIRGGSRCERILRALRSTGIGTKEKSSLAVVPCALHYAPAKKLPYHHKKRKHVLHDSQSIQDSAWATFVQSVKSRLTVAQVSEQVKADALLTFDFCFLLVVAALMSAIGLTENSTVFVVASMLISPLMGPIMAATFGTAIRDRDLQIMGVRNEFFGIFLTILVGYVFGLIISLIDDTYGVGEWPTNEIIARSDLRSLWVGALTAIPSGAAVAIAILADNTASLVGVAISASLLPPAVNAGLLWAMSTVQFLNDELRINSFVKTNNYSDNPAVELAVDGFISLCLTLINIICIYLAGVLVFKIKEVAPMHTKDEHFWKHDIKLARNFNKTIHEEAKSHDELGSVEAAAGTNSFDEAIERVKALESLRYGIGNNDLLEKFKRTNHLTWSPNTDFDHRRASAHELRGRYKKFTNDCLSTKPRLSVPTSRLTTHHKGKRKLIHTTHTETKSPNRMNLVKTDSKFTVIPVTNE